MILKMQHLDLVCVASEKESTLETLRDLGVVHLDISTVSGAAVAAAKGKAEDAEKAVRLILKARGKEDNVNLHERAVEDVLALDADRETLKSEKGRLEREIRIYAPFGDFDPELAAKLRASVDGLDEAVSLPRSSPRCGCRGCRKSSPASRAASASTRLGSPAATRDASSRSFRRWPTPSPSSRRRK